MTSRLYQECLGCEAPHCWGCTIIDNKVKEGMSRINIIGQNGPTGEHYGSVGFNDDKDKVTKEIPGASCTSQYGIPKGVRDLQDLIEHREMSFSLGNIFKACYRYGKKNDNLYEIEKIIWFANRIKEQLLNDKP